MAKTIKKVTKKSSNQSKPTQKKETNQKKKAAEAKMDKIIEDAEKKYGVNVLRKGFPSEDVNEWYNLKRFSTGVPSLDIALGGGIPVGRYIEVQGSQSVGKTTLVLTMLRNFQEQYPDLDCLFADAEGTSNGPYFEDLGIHENQFMYSPSAGLEETTQLVIDQMENDTNIKLVVLDSIEGLVPTKEYEKGMDDSVQMGLKPSIMAEFFRKFFAKNNKLMREGKMPLTIIGINQLRDKIGAYGNPEFAPGGKAKDFAQTLCIRLRRGDLIKEGSGENQEEVGHEVKFKVNKNKTYGPGKTGSFNLYTAENHSGIKKLGIDVPLSISVAAIKLGFITRSGAYFQVAHRPDLKFQGKNALFDYLGENPDIIKELQDMIIKEISKV